MKLFFTANPKLDYLLEHSNLNTNSKSHDIEVFQIAGHGHFVAFANQGRNKNTDSIIFKWTGNKLEYFQNISTDNARKWEFFTIGTEVSFNTFIKNYKTVF